VTAPTDALPDVSVTQIPPVPKVELPAGLPPLPELPKLPS
jgi:hypothetical protein